MEKTKSVPFNGTQEQEAMLHAVIDELREDKGCTAIFHMKFRK